MSSRMIMSAWWSHWYSDILDLIRRIKAAGYGWQKLELKLGSLVDPLELWFRIIPCLGWLELVITELENQMKKKWRPTLTQLSSTILCTCYVGSWKAFSFAQQNYKLELKLCVTTPWKIDYRNEAEVPIRYLILEGTPICEWYVVWCESKNWHQIDMYLEKRWIMCSGFFWYNQKHNWGTYMIIQVRGKSSLKMK